MAGNANSGRKQEKPFRDALRLELAAAEKSGRGLRVIARKLIEAAEEGKMDAIKEMADRIDGKVPQAIAGDEENPLNFVHTITRQIVRAQSSNSDS
ncbi:hypothetical protein GGE68_001422 [Rhizobium leguminosarum]|uniref:hypothetical protein n=1 Tax=Rhizobium leguminosarum TaxID=384 RepID=UPI00161A1378|nr:hypothetical protein [Rhizobium leguminosarum]MBB5663246.1 hypothetical protein [Rhizobium leguminosarum]